MLLIIPAVEIKGGKCVQMVQGHQGFVYGDDPVEICRLWRKENAKTIHVTDVDGAMQGRLINYDVIKAIVKAVDVPIELGGGLRSLGEVRKAFDAGVFRVVVGTMVIDNPDEAKRVIDEYSGSNVALGIDARNFKVQIKGMTEESGITVVSLALNARQMGFRRVIYTDVLLDGTMRGMNIEAVRLLATKSGMRITASGGIAGLDDLLKVQELEPLGVDSVIIGRALYENKFSCQGLWRRCEAGNYPFTAKV